MSEALVPESPRLSIVLPAHNEVNLLGSTVTNLITGLATREISYELLVVENGSHDGTLRLARLLAAQFDHIRVLTLARGDYGAALAAGLVKAAVRLHTGMATFEQAGVSGKED